MLDYVLGSVNVGAISKNLLHGCYVNPSISSFAAFSLLLVILSLVGVPPEFVDALLLSYIGDEPDAVLQKILGR